MRGSIRKAHKMRKPDLKQLHKETARKGSIARRRLRKQNSTEKDALMAQPGICGFGDGPDGKIIVFVEAENVKHSVPSRVDGHQTSVKITGPIQAL